MVGVKERTDKLVNDNSDVVNNRGYFTKEVNKNILDALTENNIKISRGARLSTAQKLTDLYMKQYGEDDQWM